MFTFALWWGLLCTLDNPALVEFVQTIAASSSSAAPQATAAAAAAAH